LDRGLDRGPIKKICKTFLFFKKNSFNSSKLNLNFYKLQ
jgi:hypothetical protein